MVGGIGGFIASRGDDAVDPPVMAAPVETGDADVEVVELQPANDLGPDSFTETPLATPNPAAADPSSWSEVSTVVDAAARANRVRTVEAGEVGLYGGTSDEKVCDKQQLIEFLTATENRGKAQAWVAALNADPNLRFPGGALTVAKLPAYIADQLTPALVLRDTQVVNHGFRSNGVPTTFNSILEAGTQAMVDKYGVFRVRCFCGNPLIGPSPVGKSRIKLVGKAWPEKPQPAGPTPRPVGPSDAATSPSGTPPGASEVPQVPEVVVIRAAEKPMDAIPLVQPDGRVITIRTGTDGLVSDAVGTPSATPTSAAPTTAAPTTAAPTTAAPTTAPSSTAPPSTAPPSSGTTTQPPSAAPTGIPSQPAGQACAASFCVPLRTGWSIASQTATEVRLTDSKGRTHLLQESSLTDPDAVLDQEKARREALSPPCAYVGSRDTVPAGSFSVRRDRWNASTCDVVNTLAITNPGTGRVVLAASANDSELRQVLLAGMTFR